MTGCSGTGDISANENLVLPNEYYQGNYRWEGNREGRNYWEADLTKD